MTKSVSETNIILSLNKDRKYFMSDDYDEEPFCNIKI
jgi:hypothetical protein